MQIAIVAPSPVPYTIGGAEYLWWGLLEAINADGAHQAELIKLPCRDDTLSDLVASYRRFAELDLDHFDLVISTKYPAWMVSHPNHVVYLQHKLRGLYDTYPAHLPTALPPAAKWPSEAAALREQLINGPAHRDELPALWQALDALCQTAPELTSLPGPVARAVVHYLDRIALQPPAIQRYLAISNNVAQRRDYFPDGVPVEVVYHPSHRRPPADEAMKAGGRHAQPPVVFTASRLDGPKRLTRLIRAFRRLTVDAELHIAGTGPAEADLHRAAEGDPRIKLLGWQTDEAIAQGYQRAAFVPFIPYDEDYGLITIEAMQAGRAVLTTTDAGGVNEFVSDGETGRCVAPTEAALSRAMAEMLADPNGTAAMGQAGRARVAAIDWPQTVSALAHSSCHRPRWVVVTTFPVYPPRGGGASRIYHLYREIARWVDVTLVTLTGDVNTAGHHALGPHFRELRVAKTPRHRILDKLTAQWLGASVDDIVAMDHPGATPALADTLARACQGADRVVASHSYLYPLIRQVWSGPLWYEAHNVEADMKAAVLAPTLNRGRRAAQRALARVEAVEGACAREAQCVLAVSEQEANGLRRRYGVDAERIRVAPNGTNTASLTYTGGRARARIKQQDGLADRFIALFMGSWHGPNVEAARQIKTLAGQRRDVDFVIIGSVGRAPLGALPANLRCLGVVSEAEKRLWLARVDVALNPMVSGAGSNLKLLDYAAAGVPIITTPFGNRGVGLPPQEGCLSVDIDQFSDALIQLRSLTTAQVEAMTAVARAYVEADFDWSVIASTVVQKQQGVA